MLLCTVDELTPGMVVGAAVAHPQRADMQLLSPNTELDDKIIPRLQQMGVSEVWVDYPGTDDLDKAVAGELNEKQRAVYNTLKAGFAKGSKNTISDASMREYTDAVTGFMSTVIANQNYASLVHRLSAPDDPAQAHAVGVSYLALLCGISLESYIVGERNLTSVRQAKDLSSLGLAALLHDVGKSGAPKTVIDTHEAGFDADLTAENRAEAYAAHPYKGFELLGTTSAPASARNAVLFHHLRYDGSGWPDASGLGSRFSTVPVGDKIHIFPRILAAANTLDNLLTRAAGKGLPPVAALHTFASERYTGWFDPVVRHAMLRQVPPFGIGTRVKLSDGRACVVVRPDRDQPCTPAVRPLDADANGETIPLADHPGLSIAEAQGRDVSGFAYALPKVEPGTTIKPIDDTGATHAKAA